MSAIEELAAAAGAAGEKVKGLKDAKAEKPAIDAAVAELLSLKKQITALDPAHPLALVEKKKKSEKKPAAVVAAPADDAGPSKNALAKAAKKAGKDAKKAGYKADAKAEAAPAAAAPVKAAVKAAPAPAAVVKGTAPMCVVHCAEPPQLARLVASLCSSQPGFVLDGAAGSQPWVALKDAKLFGDAAVAVQIARLAKNSAVLGGDDEDSRALVQQWVYFSIAYPALGDVTGLMKALEARLGDATYLVGSKPTMADLACWLSVKEAKKPESVERWARLMGSSCDAVCKAPLEAVTDVKEGGCPPLEGAVEGEVVTRFPPEPSGYLHIGHAKAVLLNDYYARRYKGRLIIRFDDTNPSKEKDEYAENILEDLKTLGIPVDDPTYVTRSNTSDHFDHIAKLARRLITEKLAFMDDTPQEKMKIEREERKESVHRDTAVKVNMERFEAMYAGTPGSEKWCLRAKMDMASDNGTMRDPVMFRANATPHHLTGTKYKAYPTYDLACPVVDSLEGVTHALRTTEYNDRDAQYQWLISALKLRPVRIHAFSRINFVRTLMSKRKLLWFVEQGHVEGWNDPRFPTIQGVIRRGVSVEALRTFIVAQGASRNIINLEWDSFWAINKAAYEPTAPRLMAVEKAKAATLLVTNFTDEGVVAKTIAMHPKEPSMGTRALRLAKRVFLESEDAASLKAGEEVNLMRWGVFKITKASEDKLSFEAEFLPDGDVKKKKSLSWLAEVDDLTDCLLIEYDYIITKPKLEEEDDLTAPNSPLVNLESMVQTPALGDPIVKTLKLNDVIQLERRGFFRVDQPANAKKNLPCKLIYIPDGKVKVPFSRLPSALLKNKK